MPDLHKAAQQALWALQYHVEMTWPIDRTSEAIFNLRAALAQQQAGSWQDGVLEGHLRERERWLAQEQAEPVAWRTFDGEGGYDYRSYEDNECYAAEWAQRNPNHVGWAEPLYTAPPASVSEAPQRKPLTKERLLYIYNQLPNWGMDMDSLPQGLEKFARAIERAHGIGEQP